MPALIGLGQRTAGHDVVNMRMVGQGSAPGMQDTEKAGQIGADKFFVLGKLFMVCEDAANIAA